MIVYAEREEEVNTRDTLSKLIASIGREDSTDVLIRYGQIEAAIADALQPEWDDWNETIAELRFAAILLGVASQHGCEFSYDFHRLLEFDLPKTIKLRPPEGFTYYAVYPEQYRLAAERLVAERHPKRCAVIGIRSIGATLSAIVAATVFSDECELFTYTVRPRGHPYDRYVKLSEAARDALIAAKPEYYLIVDEGPGISGSSFAAVCRTLEQDVGADPSRLILFPSWDAPASSLRSEAARAEWPRHAHMTASFEETWLEKLSADSIVDISAGAWRRYLYGTPQDYPAVNPQHERRKYVIRRGSSQLLYKFAGLGEFGRTRFRRAVSLASAGFTPEAHDFADGFAVTVFEQGRPLARTDLNPELLQRMAEYLAQLRRDFSVPGIESNGAEMADMVSVNVSEALGDEWLARIDFAALRDAFAAGELVDLDGRMLPHEWILTMRGYLKTDALDHYDDHFFPGRQDIAWDVAGVCSEWALSQEGRSTFLRAFGKLTDPGDLAERLPWYEIAYLAYRIGYCSMSMETLAHDAEEQKRFQVLKDEYVSRLQSSLPEKG